MPRPVLRTFAAVISVALSAAASIGAGRAETPAPAPAPAAPAPSPPAAEPGRSAKPADAPRPATAPEPAEAPTPTEATKPADAATPTPAAKPKEPAKQEPATKAEPAPPKGSVETPAVVIDNAQTLLGKEVRSSKGDDLGRIVDVIIDRNGLIQAAIIDFGGFLGMGSRKIAVDWRLLHFPKDGSLDKLVADLPQDQLRIAPLYRVGEPVVVIGKVAAAPNPPPAPAPAAAQPPAQPKPATEPKPAAEPKPAPQPAPPKNP